MVGPGRPCDGRSMASVQAVDEQVLPVLEARARGAVRASDAVTSEGVAFSVTCDVEQGMRAEVVRELVRRRVRAAITAPVCLPDGGPALVDLRDVTVDVLLRSSSGGARGGR